MKEFLIKLIIFYQNTIGKIKKRSCVFYPTCSEYGKEAIQKYGALKGTWMTLRRILRCHPWQTNYIDPVK